MCSRCPPLFFTRARGSKRRASLGDNGTHGLRKVSSRCPRLYPNSLARRLEPDRVPPPLLRSARHHHRLSSGLRSASLRYLIPTLLYSSLETQTTGIKMRTELPVVSFLCIGLLLLLSPVFVHSRNTAVISLAIWLLLSNTIHGVDSIVWASNVTVHVPAWCDIGTPAVDS